MDVLKAREENLINKWVGLGNDLGYKSGLGQLDGLKKKKGKEKENGFRQG